MSAEFEDRRISASVKTNWTWMFLPPVLRISLMWDPEGDQTWFSGYKTMTATALITPFQPFSSLVLSSHQSMLMSRGETELNTGGTSTRRISQASPTFSCQSHKIILSQVYPNWMSVSEAAKQDCGSRGRLWELNWAFMQPTRRLLLAQSNSVVFKDSDYASLSK